MLTRILVAVSAVAVVGTTAEAQYRRPPIRGPIIVQQPTFTPYVAPIVPQIYPTYMNPVTGTATTYGSRINPFTGTVTNFGTSYNAFTGNSSSAVTKYNPFTGNSYSNNSFYNPYIGTTSSSTVINPFTGTYITNNGYAPTPYVNPFGGGFYTPFNGQ